MTTPYNSASLYVGDLHEDATEALLYDVFREVGPIVSIRVCRDATTRKSLGYAYVNFHNAADADRALDTLNYTPIKGRPIRIMWSQRDPSVRKSGVGNVFIKNLDKSIDNKALFDTFSAFGNILSCKVSTKPEKIIVKNEQTGELEEKVISKGYGFVHFETQEAAQQAIERVNGMLLNGKKVFVGHFMKRGERLKLVNSDDKYTNIFVKNLDKSITNEEFEKMFSEFGKIQHSEVMVDESGKSKGFGFVNFETHDDAVKAVQEMHGKEIKGKKIYVARAQPKNERISQLKEKFEKLKQEKASKYQGVNLFVKNLDDNIDEEKLKAEFSKFGPITSCVIMRDDKGVSKGFGFVCFSSPEHANDALTQMNTRMLGSKPLYVNVAQKKEIRRAQLEQHFAHSRIRQNMANQPVPQMLPHGAVPMYPPTIPPQGRQFVPMVRPRWTTVAPGAPQPGAPQPIPQPRPFAGPVLPNTPIPYANVVAANVGRGRGARRQGPAPGQVPQVQAGQGRGNRGYKYNVNARNRPDQGAVPPQAVPAMNAQPVPVEQAPPQPEAALTIENLSEFPLEMQKNIIGDRLFPLVHVLQPELASKITGMLLEMEPGDLLTLIESPEALSTKVAEAVAVLNKATQQ